MLTDQNRILVSNWEIEQNEQAVDLYVHFGFETIGRSELDSSGKPYPILHMELKK